MAGAAELTQLINSFQSVAVASCDDPTWRTQLSERLSTLRRAFAEHVGLTEGPDGLYHELLDQAPRLASGVDGLVREHRELLQAMEGLSARVEAGDGAVVPEPPVVRPEEIDQVRGWASELLRELHEHRQRGADLVYEAYGTDLGGET